MDWPFLQQRELVTIHTASPEALGPQLTAWNTGASSFSSTSLQIANQVFLQPFVLSGSILVAQLWVYNGATIAGNLDIGIYGENGTRLCSTGSTAQAGSNAVQAIDIPDVRIGPGRFYLALIASTTSATFRTENSSGNAHAFHGQLISAASGIFPLPATVVFASIAPIVGRLPLVGLTGKALI